MHLKEHPLLWNCIWLRYRYESQVPPLHS